MIPVTQIMDKEWRASMQYDYALRNNGVKICPNGCGALVTSNFGYAWTTSPFFQECGGCSKRKRKEGFTDYGGSKYLSEVLAAEAGHRLAENLFGGWVGADAWKEAHNKA